MSYIMRPSEVFKLYLSEKMSVSPDGIQYGMLAMALEVVTVIKTLEALPTTSVGTRSETISVLHTLLQDVGLDVYAYEWYERLDEWRRPTFVPSVEQPHTDVSAVQIPALSPSRASQLASTLLEEQALLDTDVQLGSDQPTDQTSDELEPQASEEAKATSDE